MRVRRLTISQRSTCASRVTRKSSKSRRCDSAFSTESMCRQSSPETKVVAVVHSDEGKNFRSIRSILGPERTTTELTKKSLPLEQPLFKLCRILLPSLAVKVLVVELVSILPNLAQHAPRAFQGINLNKAPISTFNNVYISGSRKVLGGWRSLQELRTPAVHFEIRGPDQTNFPCFGNPRNPQQSNRTRQNMS